MTTNEENTRLAVYGTLAPGGPNEHVLADIPGTWTPGVVRGTRFGSGWGAALGYPGIVLDDGGDVACQLFESDELPQHWAELDEFEGPGYLRLPVAVRTADGERRAFIYALSEAPMRLPQSRSDHRRD